LDSKEAIIASCLISFKFLALKNEYSEIERIKLINLILKDLKNLKFQFDIDKYDLLKMIDFKKTDFIKNSENEITEKEMERQFFQELILLSMNRIDLIKEMKKVDPFLQILNKFDIKEESLKNFNIKKKKQTNIGSTCPICYENKCNIFIYKCKHCFCLECEMKKKDDKQCIICEKELLNKIEYHFVRLDKKESNYYFFDNLKKENKKIISIVGEFPDFNEFEHLVNFSKYLKNDDENIPLIVIHDIHFIYLYFNISLNNRILSEKLIEKGKLNVKN
jgi:hypothetical protein